MTSAPVIDGWFTTDGEPRLLGQRCSACTAVFFPPLRHSCANPACGGTELEPATLSRTGRVWSYASAQYQPPPPYPQAADGEYVPFALVAVELPEGLVVLGQVAEGFGVDDLEVGAAVELVVEPLERDDTGERTTWRWRPVDRDQRAGAEQEVAR